MISEENKVDVSKTIIEEKTAYFVEEIYKFIEETKTENDERFNLLCGFVLNIMCNAILRKVDDDHPKYEEIMGHVCTTLCLSMKEWFDIALAMKQKEHLND